MVLHPPSQSIKERLARLMEEINAMAKPQLLLVSSSMKQITQLIEKVKSFDANSTAG